MSFLHFPGKIIERRIVADWYRIYQLINGLTNHLDSTLYHVDEALLFH